ncbi:MAG: hypothetical protein IT204_14620 [Fimbriimonadaceae bacterium]|nr:hypothetical protein [Fimbriimonadaceae bacterium]
MLWSPVGVLLLAAGNLVVDGDFERADLKLLPASDPVGVWQQIRPADSGASFTLEAGAGRQGSRAIRYQKASAGNSNSHLDQLVPVQPETFYEVRAWVRGDGKLQPVCSVATRHWRQLVVHAVPPSTDWQEVRLVVHSGAESVLRLEWFGGSDGQLYRGVAGQSWLDDVSVVALAEASPVLQQAFAVSRPQAAALVDPAKVQPGAIGPAAPLRPIRRRDGVLVYPDGSEVALWGVNLQTALSWEWQGRLRPAGVPLTAEALQGVTDRNLADLRLLGLNLLRLHLLPADFSGPDGALRDSVYLDALDHLLARCNEQGLYVYLTLVNEMNTRFQEDSFMLRSSREQWVCDPAFSAPMARYTQGLLQHVNRYTQRAYRDEPCLALLELINEPAYPDYAQLAAQPELAGCRAAFEAWQRQQAPADPPASVYAAWRYQRTKQFLTEQVAAVRAAGATQPVFWNCNWPNMIRGREEVFQAIAESPVDGVSFCLYPGQSDLPNPFWAHPTELSDRDYLPYVTKVGAEYEQLRWLLGQRFAGKAKAVYEFETMYQQSRYLYPAMARQFRALGAQAATMWQYTLSPVAEFHGGSHYLNVATTPEKAVSFRIAGEVFGATPRLAAFPAVHEQQLGERGWVSSQAHNTALWRHDGQFLHAGPVDWCPLPLDGPLTRIVGVGSSPYVEYAGAALYSLEIEPQTATLTVLPTPRFTRPLWQRATGQRLCTLDGEVAERFVAKLPGWAGLARVQRIDGEQAVDVPLDAAGGFPARAGSYRLLRR